MFDKEPDEKLVGQETKAGRDEETYRAQMRFFAATVPLEAPAAVDKIAKNYGECERDKQCNVGIDIGELCNGPIADSDKDCKADPRYAKADDLAKHRAIQRVTRPGKQVGKPVRH